MKQKRYNRHPGPMASLAALLAARLGAGLIAGLIVLAAARPVASQTAAGPAAPAAVLPASLVDHEFVDIWHGFAIRPPKGSIILNDPNQSGQPGSVPAPPKQLDQWESLRVPESQSLVRFWQGPTQTELEVFLLVSKARTPSIDALREAREGFWQKFPTQATLQMSRTDRIQNRDAALLAITWKPTPQAETPLFIQEIILNYQANRFFLISLARPVRDETEREQAEALLQILLKNFSCFNPDEEQRRRQQARQLGQQFLKNLSFQTVQPILQDRQWFRVRLGAEEAGFLLCTEQVQTVEEKTRIRIRCESYIATPRAGREWIRLRGWGRGLLEEEFQPRTATAGALRLTEDLRLQGDLHAETFRVEVVYPDAPSLNYREEGAWSAGVLNVKYFDDPAETQKHFTGTLQVNDPLYLPAVLAVLRGRCLQPKLQQEYIFQRYSNRALRDESLRIVARTTLEIAPAAAEPSKPTTPQTTPPASAPAPTTASEPAPAAALDTLYLVEQTGMDGPIVETWLDAEGRLIQQRTNNGLLLLRSSARTIETLWPQPVRTLLSANETAP
ncbi:MAG: hypothetical protein JW810_10680 [Sedimentisphaerales bacterium]|nr:hypothetical protein [Sedimentisphaerales bacterium]